jgi:hypothetical protein
MLSGSMLEEGFTVQRTTACRSTFRAAWVSIALIGTFLPSLLAVPIARAESAPMCFNRTATVVGTA